MSQDLERSALLARSLELMPGLISWGIIIGPVWLSFSYPWLVGFFVLAFEAYWLARVLWCTGAVALAHRRTNRVLAEDWGARLATLDARPVRREWLLRQVIAGDARPRAVLGFSALAADRPGRRHLRAELALLDAVDRLTPPPPSATEFVQVALIATRGESLEQLRRAVAAVAVADWPRDRKICAIITRPDDDAGTANVASLRDEFADAFLECIEIVDSRVSSPGSDAGSVMAFGARHLHRLLARDRGLDPTRILVTALHADHRVHPQYFTHLTWTHLIDEHREARLYRPIPYLHNELWQAPIRLRLVAVVLTQLGMWRSIVSARLQGTRPYSMTLKLAHEVGYWATDATPGDSRFFWRGSFTQGGRFRVVPLFIPISADASRARGTWRFLARTYLQASRWARGATDLPFVIENAARHGELPPASRVRPIVALLGEHAAWAIAPVVLGFGVALPVVLSLAFGPTALGPGQPTAAATMLAAALVAQAVLAWIAYRIVPPYPPEWGILRRATASVQWVWLPIVGLLASGLPGLDPPQLRVGERYPEKRVTGAR